MAGASTATTEADNAPTEGTDRRYAVAAIYGISALVIITLFAFVDRQIFVLLAEPIKLDLDLSDFQLGMLQGLGLALFGALAGYPIGWLADRYDRRYVLAGCLVVWSLAVAACGFAPDFAFLFLFSAMIGAGEAGLTPIIYSLIPDMVKEKHRQLANSVYTVAQQFSYGIGSAICAAIVAGIAIVRPDLPSWFSDKETWRLAFFVAAMPAPIMVALLISIRLRKGISPPPQAEASATTDEQAPALSDSVLRHLKTNWQTMTTFYLGIGFAAFGFASLLNWVPAITMRQYGIDAVTVGSITGVATIIATLVGFIFGSIMLRYLKPRFGINVPIVALWTATLSAAITSFLLIFTTSAMQIFVLQGVQYAFIIGAFLVYPTAIQDISPVHLRGRLISILVIVRMVLVASSPLLVGAFSDLMAERKEGLLWSATGLATGSLLVAAFLLWLCGRTYQATVEASR